MQTVWVVKKIETETQRPGERRWQAVDDHGRPFNETKHASQKDALRDAVWHAGSIGATVRQIVTDESGTWVLLVDKPAISLGKQAG